MSVLSLSPRRSSRCSRQEALLTPRYARKGMQASSAMISEHWRRAMGFLPSRRPLYSLSRRTTIALPVADARFGHFTWLTVMRNDVAGGAWLHGERSESCGRVPRLDTRTHDNSKAERIVAFLSSCEGDGKGRASLVGRRCKVS